MPISWYLHFSFYNFKFDIYIFLIIFLKRLQIENQQTKSDLRLKFLISPSHYWFTLTYFCFKHIVLSMKYWNKKSKHNVWTLNYSLAILKNLHFIKKKNYIILYFSTSSSILSNTVTILKLVLLMLEEIEPTCGVVTNMCVSQPRGLKFNSWSFMVEVQLNGVCSKLMSSVCNLWYKIE